MINGSPVGGRGSGHRWFANLSPAVLLVLVLVTASCTGNEAAVESTSTVVTTSAPTTSTSTTTTTTTQAPSLDELLRSTLAGDDFSATVAAAAVTTQPIGTITATGTGSINGPDSELRLNSDLTGLLGTFMDGKGRVIGKRGLSEISQHTIVIDGVQYRQDNGDKWRISEATEPDTTLGHVVAALGAVPMFDEAGSETIDGRILTVMRPTAGAEYDPRFFDFDPAVVLAFNADTSVLADGEGLPVQIRVTVQAEIESGETTLPTDIELTYDLSEIGSTAAVQPPSRHWVTLSSLGFFGADTPTLFDMEVPADWIVIDQDVGIIQFDTPSLRVTTFLDDFDEKVSVEDSMPQLLSIFDIEGGEVAEPDYSVFPSRFATQQNSDRGGYMMLYQEVKLGHLVLSIVWSGPLDAFELQQTDFEDILDTINWSTLDSGFMPGESIGSEELQADTLSYLLITIKSSSNFLTASIVSDCDEPIPLWTDLVSGGFDTWTEDWYFNTCGTIEIYEVTYTLDPEGGAFFTFSSEPREPGE